MKHSYFARRNRYALVLLLSIFCVLIMGMSGYMLLEGVSVLEALYMAIGTLTTVSPFTLSDQGRIFSILLLFLGFGMVAATAGYLGNMLLDGNWLDLYRRRKVLKSLKSYADHYIVCGHGQVGKRVVDELHHHNKPVVVIDNNEEVLLRCKELGVPHLDWDAMEEEALEAAGVERAKALVSVVNRDADNVYIVLTARSMNPELFICARASSQGVENKLKRAGADRVVSPYASAAMRITQNILRPSVSEFLDQALSGKGLELELEELYITDDSPLASWERVSCEAIREDFDLIIVAIMRKEGEWIYNPKPEQVVEVNDTVIAVGPKASMDYFFEYLYGVGRQSPS